MYKKTIFTLLLFLAPIGIIELHKKDSSPRIINYEYNMIKKNHLHQIDDLFKADEEKDNKETSALDTIGLKPKPAL